MSEPMQGCPEGMYPPGTEAVDYPDTASTLAELQEIVEPMLGPLNFPIGWWFNTADNQDFDPNVGEHKFEFVVWMPRKMKTWSVTITDFKRAEVQQWIDTTVRAAVEEWYGFR